VGAIAARPSERIAARPGLFVAIVGPSGAGKDSAILASSARLAARCRVFAVLRRFPLGAGEAA
jgi:ribose 1,5-bisphosphokinase PhnN